MFIHIRATRLHNVSFLSLPSEDSETVDDCFSRRYDITTQFHFDIYPQHMSQHAADVIVSTCTLNQRMSHPRPEAGFIRHPLLGVYCNSHRTESDLSVMLV